jgi:hypothetical protein
VPKWVIFKLARLFKAERYTEFNIKVDFKQTSMNQMLHKMSTTILIFHLIYNLNTDSIIETKNTI